jgi:hypothetical protein
MKYTFFMILTLILYIYNNTDNDWEDILTVHDLNYYDEYSFKDNWAISWRDSDVW